MKFAMMRDAAPIPMRGSQESAGLDLRADLSEMDRDAIEVHSGATFLCPTGVALAIPKGKVGLMFSRSGHGAKRDVRLANAVGVIDSDYRQELFVAVRAGREDFVVKHGDRVAQLVVVDCHLDLEQCTMADLDEFHDAKSSDRVGGLGSTGR